MLPRGKVSDSFQANVTDGSKTAFSSVLRSAVEPESESGDPNNTKKL